MTYSEALAILGIDAQTDKRSARRAYLRKVKQHKPERDPDGFQRVRSAWELVENRLTAPPWDFATPARFDPPVTPRTPPRPVERVEEPVEPEVAEPVEVPEEPHTEPEPEPDDRPEISDEPAPWDIVEPDLPPGQWRVERIVPDDAIPPPAPPEVHGPAPAVLIHHALEACEDDPDHAAALLRQAIDQALQGREPAPDLSTTIHVVLELHARASPAVASDAWKQVDRWIELSGVGTRISSHVAIGLVFARELSDLPPHFPATVRHRIAEAALEHETGQAQQDLLDLYRSRPHIALDAAELLEARAPNLHRMFGGSLRDPAGTQSPPPGKDQKSGSEVNPMIFVYVAILMLTIGLRFCVSGSSSPPAAYTPIQLPAPTFEPYTFDPIDLPQIADIDTIQPYPSFEMSVLALCIDAFGHPAAACSAGKAVEIALDADRCVDARAALEQLEAIEGREGASADSLSNTETLKQRIAGAVHRRCGGEEDPVEP